MGNRYQFKITELTATILGVAIYYETSVLQYGLYEKGSVIFGEYIFIPGIVISIIAAIYGPIVGVLVGTAGQLLANMYVYNSTDPIDIAVAIALGLIMGHIAKRLNVRKGRFGLQEAADFNIVHLFILMITVVMIRPLFCFLFEGMDYIDGLQIGMHVAAGGIITMLIIGTPVMWFISLASRKIMITTTMRGLRRE